MRWLTFFVVVLLTPWQISAQSVDIGHRRRSFTEGELALLPPYCRDTYGTPGYTNERGDRWRSLLGHDFLHFHHYCRGMRDVHFARTALLSARDRRFLWNRSVGEFQYMVRNSKPDMVLMPEILTRLGESYLELGDFISAQVAFERARTLKPDYWPAYTAWVDRLMAVSQNEAARKLLEEGLAHAPDHPELASRLKRLNPPARP